MSVNTLHSVCKKILHTGSYLIGSHRVFPSTGSDYYTLCNGLVLWCGILLDHDLMLGSSNQEHRAFSGRVQKLVWLKGEKSCDLTSLLVLLDDLDDLLLSEISGPERFKGASFLKKVKASTHVDVIVDLVRRTCLQADAGRLDDSMAVRLLHQSFCFLKKMQIDRPDLVRDAKCTFHQFEEELSRRPSLRDNPEALAVISEMNALMRLHSSDFCLHPYWPKHGPGVVSSPDVKVWYDKYLHMASDARIEYLLSHNELGTQLDYCPWMNLEKSSRTSRFISVPKTWKKLRGISAEPVELQFHQQAILARLDAMFSTSNWWRQRVDLHDQAKSAYLARMGSIHGGYATIDLSSASDSVTLELVKMVFKGTPILSWLLGTRSVFTECDKHITRLCKFAPMGSACCFPVECIIFTLAAQVASDRAHLPFERNTRTIRVFGDDIIIDWFAAPELLKILSLLGFSVNTDKTYIAGGFREACGVEAYRGVEIQPLRYKRLGWSPTTEAASTADITTALSYCNSLYERGYHSTRSFLVYTLLNKEYKLSRSRRRVARYLPVTFSGARGSLASPSPTNFNRLMKWDRGLQTLVVRSIGFRICLEKRKVSREMSLQRQWFDYHEWQLGHQPGCADFSSRWEKGWIDLQRYNAVDARLPLGFIMVPIEKWTQWDYYDSLV